MADEFQMTTEEHAANAAKLQAEAEKALAEATKARTETIEAEAKARVAVLDAAKKEDDDQNRRATDDYHHVYRFDGTVTADTVKKCMERLTVWHRIDPKCDIEVIFSSPGGSIFDGMELFDFLRDMSDSGHEVITGGIGMAASMAGILLQAGDHRWVGKETWLLIHRASFLTYGSTYEVEDMVELIKRIEKRIIEIFTTRSGGKLTSNRIKRNWNRKDWWLDSDDCIELGLVDEVRSSSLPSTNGGSSD